MLVNTRRIRIKSLDHCSWFTYGVFFSRSTNILHGLSAFIIQLSHTVLISIFWLVDLYHVTLGCDGTSLMSLLWCNSHDVNSTHHCNYTMAFADSEFDDFCLQVFNSIKMLMHSLLQVVNYRDLPALVHYQWTRNFSAC